jgi:hypothetical protein
MSIRLSTATRNKLLDGGTGGGIKNMFNLGFINLYTGSQPNTPSVGATGTLLGTVTVNGDGTTGVGFDAAAAGVIAKAVAQTWKFTGLAAGIPGWFRLYAAGGTPSTTDDTQARLDGGIGSSGADLNLTNLNVQIGQVNTVDSFTVTMPAA